MMDYHLELGARKAFLPSAAYCQSIFIMATEMKLESINLEIGPGTMIFTIYLSFLFCEMGITVLSVC